MHFCQSPSAIDLGGKISSGMRSLYHENQIVQNGHNPDPLMSGIYKNGYLGYDMEKVRQTILKHELIFRNQLQELHRLYRRQRELMNEIKKREIQDTRSTCNALLSKSNILPERAYNLKIPADAYKDRYSNLPRNHQASYDTDAKSSLTAVWAPQCDVDPWRSNLLLRKTNNQADLNISNPTDGNTGCRGDVSANSYPNFHLVSSDLFKISLDGMNGGGFLIDLGSRNETSGKEHRSADCAEKRRLDEHSSIGDFCFGKAPTFPQSVLTEPRNEFLNSPLDMGKSVSWKKRPTIFGVEFSEGHDDPTDASSNTSSTILQNNLINSESFPGSLGKNESITLDLKVSSHMENYSVASFESPSWISNSFLHNLDLGGSHVNDVKNRRPKADLKDEISSQNRFRYPENGKCLQDCSSIGLNFFQVPYQYTESDPKHCFENLDDMNSMPAEVLKRDSEHSQKFQNMVPQHSPVLADCQSKLENPSKGGLPWFLKDPQYSIEPSKGMKNSYFMNLDSLQNCSEKFFRRTEIADGSFQTLKLKKKISAPMAAQDAKDGTNDINHGTSAKKVLDFPISNILQSFKDLNSGDTLLKVKCSGIEDDSARKLKKDEDVPRNQLGNKDPLLKKGLNSYMSNLRHHIDLNLSLDDEDAQSAPSLPSAIIKIATAEIDLEAPIVTEFEADPSPREGKMVVPWGKSEVSSEECDKFAAEVMIAISSVGKNNLVDDGTWHSPKAESSNRLKWFAEITSSQCGDAMSVHMDVPLDQNGACDDEEPVPDGMDYFEFMTLKLEDTKEEHSCHKLHVLKNQSDEEAGVSTLSRRSGRRQSRRGRGRVDFQKDVLPGLLTLSRHEVTEDFQTFEELLKAEGCARKVGLSQRNSTRNGRGRKHSGVSSVSPTRKAPCPNPTQQPIFRLEERSLTGWGKRTRRLPRQRCLNKPVKC